MASLASPAAMRAYIIERLVGETGEPDAVVAAAQRLAARAEPVFAAALRSLLATPLALEARDVAVARVADARGLIEAGHVLAAGSGASAPDAALMLLDPQALALLVSAMFGGDPTLSAAPSARDPSPIELDVAAAVLGELAAALNGGEKGDGLGLVLPLPAPLAGGEARKFALRDGPAVRLTLRLSAGASSGDISLFVVQRVLLARREAPAAGPGSEWGPRIGEEIMRSAATLEATMPLSRLTLGALTEWAPGAVVPIDAGADGQVELSVRGKKLFLCEFGRLGAHYTVRVKEPFDAARDFMEGLLPG